VFIAFDLLYLDGKDLRTLPLIERKALLKNLLRRKRSRILYLDHVEGDGPIAV
jgi:bifunctional non-homologous end joining protein LigD